MRQHHAEGIAWYMEAHFQNIVHDLPDSFYRKARIVWVDLPDFAMLKDGSGRILAELLSTRVTNYPRTGCETLPMVEHITIGMRKHENLNGNVRDETLRSNPRE